MLKPLSQKTLEKKYAELGLSQNKIDLLHQYFLCFSNLYGVLPIRDAWEIFKHYEGIAVHKKDFVAFSGIVQREGKLPYSIYEQNEIYSEENADPLYRMIVNNKLVLSGYNKFIYIYATVDRQGDKPYYIPEKKIFESFTEDRFYLTPHGNDMKSFIGNLKTTGVSKEYDGKSNGELTDLSGFPVKGKCLAECIFYTQNEKFELEYFKSESKKQKLLETFNIPASEKILQRIEEYIMTGGVFEKESPAQEMEFLVDFLNEDFGVELSEMQFERFSELFMGLNNKSNLWLNCGWSPDELFKKSAHKMPSSISMGPNMKKMFASGEMDREEFEKQLAQMGIALSDE